MLHPSAVPYLLLSPTERRLLCLRWTVLLRFVLLSESVEAGVPGGFEVDEPLLGEGYGFGIEFPDDFSSSFFALDESRFF